MFMVNFLQFLSWLHVPLIEKYFDLQKCWIPEMWIPGKSNPLKVWPLKVLTSWKCWPSQIWLYISKMCYKGDILSLKLVVHFFISLLSNLFFTHFKNGLFQNFVFFHNNVSHSQFHLTSFWLILSTCLYERCSMNLHWPLLLQVFLFLHVLFSCLFLHFSLNLQNPSLFYIQIFAFTSDILEFVWNMAFVWNITFIERELSVDLLLLDLNTLQIQIAFWSSKRWLGLYHRALILYKKY